MSKSQWEMARPNEAKMYDVMDAGVDYERLAKDLLSWISDDEVGDFAQQYGYFDWLDDEDEEENEVEEDEEVDLKLSYGDYEANSSYTKIKISTSVFDGFEKDHYLNVQLVDESFSELIYTCVMRSIDDEYIYCDIID